MASKRRKILLLILKLLVTAGLLTWVLSKVSWDNYVVEKGTRKSLAVPGQNPGPTATVTPYQGMLWWKTASPPRPATDFEPVEKDKPDCVIVPGFYYSLQHVNGVLLAIGVMGFGLSVLITATRWWLLLGLQDIRISLWESIRLTFLGTFFNQVMPSTVGGDLVKAYYVTRHAPGKGAGVLVSVFVDRVLGLTELAFMGAVMVAIVILGGMEPFDKVKNAVLVVSVVAVGVAMALTFLLSSRFRKMFHLQALYQRLPIAKHIAAAGDAARLYSQRLPALAKAIGVTVGAQVIWISSIALLGMSLGLPIPWYFYFTYVPLIYIIGAVPAAPGGVGLVEGAYVEFFKMVNPSTILVLALMARIIPVLWSLPGIIVAITGPKLPKAAQIQAELHGQEGQPPAD